MTFKGGIATEKSVCSLTPVKWETPENSHVAFFKMDGHTIYNRGFSILPETTPKP